MLRGIQALSIANKPRNIRSTCRATNSAVAMMGRSTMYLLRYFSAMTRTKIITTANQVGIYLRCIPPTVSGRFGYALLSANILHVPVAPNLLTLRCLNPDLELERSRDLFPWCRRRRSSVSRWLMRAARRVSDRQRVQHWMRLT